MWPQLSQSTTNLFWLNFKSLFFFEKEKEQKKNIFTKSCSSSVYSMWMLGWWFIYLHANPSGHIKTGVYLWVWTFCRTLGSKVWAVVVKHHWWKNWAIWGGWIENAESSLVLYKMQRLGFDGTKMQMSKLVCFPFSLHSLFLSHVPALPSRHVALLFHVTHSSHVLRLQLISAAKLLLLWPESRWLQRKAFPLAPFCWHHVWSTLTCLHSCNLPSEVSSQDP